MNLVKHNDPILITQCQPFNFQEPPFDPVDFSRELVKFMYDNNGIGLAANQVGVTYKIFAMRGEPENFVWLARISKHTWWPEILEPIQTIIPTWKDTKGNLLDTVITYLYESIAKRNTPQQ